MKQNKNLLEQIKIQEQIIKELVCKTTLLEIEINALKSDNAELKSEIDDLKSENAVLKMKTVEICNTCGKLYLFTTSKNCCT